MRVCGSARSDICSKLTSAGSSDIIQMQLPGAPCQPNTSYDYLYDMFGGSTFTTPAQTPLLSATAPSPAGFSVMHLPRRLGVSPATEDSDGYSSEGSLASDFENFSLVGRPRPGLDFFSVQDQTDSPPTTSFTVKNNSEKQSASLRASKESQPAAREHHTLLRDAVEADNELRRTASSPIIPMDHDISEIPADYSRSDEQSSKSLEDVFSDTDDSDSDWSVISGHSSPRSKAPRIPVVKHPLYSLNYLADSTETIIAASDAEALAPEEQPASMDFENGETGWEVSSDEEKGVSGPD